jgi:hypothetical protein
MIKLIDILNEVTLPAPKFPLPFKSGGVNLTGEAAWNKWRRWADINRKDKYIDDVLNTIKRNNYQTTQRQLDVLVRWFSGVRESLLEAKKKRDRCLRIADRRYKKPSAYKSGAAERCRAGKIWKDLKENWQDTSWENEKSQKVTLLQLLDIIKDYPITQAPIEKIKKIIIKKDTGGIESDRLNKADFKHPIIVVVDDQNDFKYILDGNHRANKAIDIGLKSIPVKLVNIKKLPQEFQGVLKEEDLNNNHNQDSIKQVFKDTPELSNIGTVEQYTKYLKTIFPNSRVKDIVLHNSPNKFEKFNVNRGRLGKGVYFGLGYKIYNTGQYNYNALLNVTNLKRYNKGEFVITANKLYPSSDEYSTKPQDSLRASDKAQGIDGYVSTSPVGTEYLVFEPEQIHILGSKQDIEGFKKYVDKTITEELIREKTKETLRTWFKRQGPKGKEGGWIDCNAPDGKGGYKACGRKKGEERAKYPACKATAAQCKAPGKGKTWGKKSK